VRVELDAIVIRPMVDVPNQSQHPFVVVRVPIVVIVIVMVTSLNVTEFVHALTRNMIEGRVRFTLMNFAVMLLVVGMLHVAFVIDIDILVRSSRLQ
jgi:hypothetical protein